MTPRPINLVFFFGGFSAVGGIESFASDLLHAIRGRIARISLMTYGKANHPLLAKLRAVGITVQNSVWRWGCKWSFPELVLILRTLPALRRADLIVFGKSFSPRVLRFLAAAASVGRSRRSRFLLVTPYKPLDLWRSAGEARVLEFYDAIFVQAECFEKDLRTLGYKGQVNVLPYIPPLAPDNATPLHVSPPIRLGFLGRLEPQKNLSYLVKIFGTVLSHVPVELHVFGAGSEKDKLVQQVAAEDLSRNAFFHGHIPREGVAAKIDSCDLFLITSVSEGQCLAALEILSRGRPLLATPVGALPEILNEAGFGEILPPEDVAKAASIVRRVIADLLIGKWKAERVVSIYRAKYAAEEVVDSYVEAFADLVKDGDWVSSIREPTGSESSPPGTSQ